MPIIVLTGVENAGKTTLAKALSEEWGWSLIPEAARQDETVRSGRTGQQDLQRLLTQFRRRLDEHDAAEDRHLLCDTGALVLDMWSREVFGTSLPDVEETMKRADLHLLCHTLPEWTPDPLRTLPKFEDRLSLQEKYRSRLAATGIPFAEIEPAPLSQRVAQVQRALRTLRP